MDHRFHLASTPFRLIESGEKVVELRLNDAKRQTVNVGDTILFVGPRLQEIKVRVAELLVAATFRDLLGLADPRDAGYPCSQDALAALRSFYTPEQEREYSALGIRFELL